MIEVDDNFNFKRLQMDKSGLLIPGAAKHIEEVKNNQAVILLISQNNDSFLVYELKKYYNLGYAVLDKTCGTNNCNWSCKRAITKFIILLLSFDEF